MTTHTTLRTTAEKDDVRVIQAFESAQRNHRMEARLVTEQNPKQQTRDALLTVTARSKREALDGLAAAPRWSRRDAAAERSTTT